MITSPLISRTPVVMSWSGGKDSSLALAEVLADPRYEVVSLLTTLSREYDRISHHGVRGDLLEAQAAAIGIPLHRIYLESGIGDCAAMSEYENLMRETMLGYVAKGVTTVCFGDIFLQDLRDYRESKLAEVGMSAVFPLWQRDTTQLARDFIDQGFKAFLSCVECERLGESFAGARYDTAMLKSLPDGVDPCGENGEFHSFVCDGPIFKRPVPVDIGETVHRDKRVFSDLVPAVMEVH